MAPAAGTANTEASMQAERAAGANTPSRDSRGLFDITPSSGTSYLGTKLSYQQYTSDQLSHQEKPSDLILAS